MNFDLGSVNGSELPIKQVLFEGNAICREFQSDICTSLCSFTELPEALA